MKKIIILDRDGVINYDSDEYIKSPDEWRAIPGSLEAIAKLNRAGYDVVVASNQSGIGRGYYDVSTLDLIHEKMQSELAVHGGRIDAFFFCPHLPRANCNCRKPKPGMLQQIQQKYALDMKDVFFIGDKLTDVQAARASGCKPLLILTGLKISEVESNPELNNVPYFLNLLQAVDYVIKN